MKEQLQNNQKTTLDQNKKESKKTIKFLSHKAMNIWEINGYKTEQEYEWARSGYYLVNYFSKD